MKRGRRPPDPQHLRPDRHRLREQCHGRL